MSMLQTVQEFIAAQIYLVQDTGHTFLPRQAVLASVTCNLAQQSRGFYAKFLPYTNTGSVGGIMWVFPYQFETPLLSRG